MTAVAPVSSARKDSFAPAVVALTLCVASQFTLVGLLGGHPIESRNEWSVSFALWGLLVVPTFWLVVAAWRGQEHGWRGLGPAVVATGLLMRLPYVAVGPLFEDDHFRYLLDGAMVSSGNSPYRYAPADLLARPELARLVLSDQARGVISQINFPDLRTIYPGTAQILFAIANIVAPWNLAGLRAVAFTSEVLTAVLMLRFIAHDGSFPWRVAVVWCNPLLAFTLTGQAHVDAAIMPLILVALLAAKRQLAAAAGLVVGFAIGVKLWPALLVPVIARALSDRPKAMLAFLLTAALTALALCLPLVISTATPKSGLAAYASGWAINNAPYAWASFMIEGFGGTVGAISLRISVAVVAALLALWLALRPATDLQSLIARLCAVSAAVFYLSPAQFPWYAAWFLPLAALSGSWSLIAASVLLPTYYFFFPLAASGARDVFVYGVAAIHILPIVAMCWIVQRGEPRR